MAPFTSTSNRAVVCMAAVVCAVWIGTPRAGAWIDAQPSQPPESARLDEASLREAVTFGETGEPEPYLLYSNPGPRDQPTVALYTPFVRVALAAQAARKQGRRLDVSALPQWVVGRDILVVVRPTGGSVNMAKLSFPEDPPLTETPLTQIALKRRPGSPFVDFIRPRLMTSDLSGLAVLGGLPFPDAVGAAAFDPDLFVEGVDVWGWWRKENHIFPSHGFLDVEEMKRWR